MHAKQTLDAVELQLLSFMTLLFHGSDQSQHDRLNKGLRRPKNHSEGFGEDKTLALAWNRSAFSWLSSQLSNPHTESASQAVYTSLRSVIILYL